MQNRQLFRNREFTEPDLLTNKKKKKQVSPILEIIFGVFGRYLADIDDLFLF